MTHRHQRGFTLIEVMMAVTIVAIMSTLVWASFGRLFHVSEEIKTRGEFWHGVRIALNRISREVGVAFISENYDRERYRSDDPEGRPTFFVIEDGGENDELHFTGFVNHRLYLDEKVSDQAIVSYFLETDEDGVQNLYRRQKNVIDEDWDRGGETNLLMENVTGFDVQWWDPEDETWEREWSTREADMHDRIPSRLRITLKTVDPDGNDRTFSTQARVMLTRPLSW